MSNLPVDTYMKMNGDVFFEGVYDGGLEDNSQTPTNKFNSKSTMLQDRQFSPSLSDNEGLEFLLS